MPGLSGVCSKAPDSAVMHCEERQLIPTPSLVKKPEHSEGFIGCWSVGIAWMGSLVGVMEQQKALDGESSLHTVRTSGPSMTGLSRIRTGDSREPSIQPTVQWYE